MSFLSDAIKLNFVRSRKNSLGNLSALLGPNGLPVAGTEQPARSNIIKTYGKSLLVTALKQTVSLDNITPDSDPASWDYTRHGFATRKVHIDMSLNTGLTYAQIRFPSISIPADTDPTDRAFSMAVYLPNHPNEFLGSGKTPGINVRLSQIANGGAGPSETWIFNANFLRQGWNILTMRQNDRISTNSSTDDEGNLPKGVTHLGSNPLVWSNAIQYMELTFNNMDGWNVYLDDLRRAAKGFTVFNVGFDAGGINSADDTFVNKVAQLFQKYGFTSYMTVSGIDTPFTGGTDWNRRITVHEKYGWDLIPHVKSHGATAPGAVKALTTGTVSRTANVVTITFASTHNLNINQAYKVNLSGFVTNPGLNGSWRIMPTTAFAFTFAATGAGAGADFAAGTETGAIFMRTFLSEVLNADTPENQAICDMEITENARTLRGMGLSRAAPFIAYPNNSVPHLTLLTNSCAKAGIKIGRGVRAGFFQYDEFGIDNPLHCGSYELGSGSGTTGLTAGGSSTNLSYILAKINASVERKCGLMLYGHYIVDESQYAPGTVNLEYPPGVNGNPAPAAITAAGGGGAWWLGSLEQALALMRSHVDAGNAVYLGPSAMVPYFLGK